MTVCPNPNPEPAGESLFTGAFAVAWNAFVAVWTVGALAGGGVLMALFSLPFWAAGFAVSRCGCFLRGETITDVLHAIVYVGHIMRTSVTRFQLQSRLWQVIDACLCHAKQSG